MRVFYFIYNNLKIKMDLKIFQVGTVASYLDSVIIAYELDRVFIGELVQLQSQHSDLLGVVLNIEHQQVKIALIHGSDKQLKAGDKIYRTYKAVQTKAGFGLLGRVVDPLGYCLNRKDLDDNSYLLNELFNVRNINIERDAPSIIQREPVRTPLLTGINAVDTLIPIGCGQRELILGDLGTGKTSLALTTIMNQKTLNNSMWREVEKHAITEKHIFFVPCIYVVVGGKRSEQSRIKKLLDKHEALSYTVIVFSSADNVPALQYFAPYAGSSIGEYFRDAGYRSLVIYDDLTNHAQAYRQLSLLLRRPPGREAYPGDIFYIHSRLLERAAQMSRQYGGGSLTALPIVTTKAGDISGYIPTNVISITDGQIFLSSKLANQGLFPAIDLNLSVSRVGSDAQVPAMKAVSKKIRIDYSIYRTYAGIEKLGGDVDPTILNFISRGKKIVVFFKQDLYITCPLYKQVLSLYAISKGYLDNVKVELVPYYFNLLFDSNLAIQYLGDNAWLIFSATKLEYVMKVIELAVFESLWEIILDQFAKIWERSFSIGASKFLEKWSSQSSSND